MCRICRQMACQMTTMATCPGVKNREQGRPRSFSMTRITARSATKQRNTRHILNGPSELACRRVSPEGRPCRSDCGRPTEQHAPSKLAGRSSPGRALVLVPLRPLRERFLKRGLREQGIGTSVLPPLLIVRPSASTRDTQVAHPSSRLLGCRACLHRSFSSGAVSLCLVPSA